jgi:glycerol-3-phosphate acyltransferase PlsY
VNPFANSSFVLSALAVAAAYLAGSIPFGYLVARWARGIDIRTVGSGNLGATNVGRTLGFRYFLLVLLLDLLKGFLPTIGFPWLLKAFTGSSPVDLPVLLALAAILGHTFPIYLRFRGGKGVATSLGGVLALDPVSCGIAALAFLIFLVATRYVSLSSLLAGVVFVVAHFLREPYPWNREHIAMSAFSIAVLILLFLRHRSNLVRIWAGTERRVSFGRGNTPGPNGQPQSCGKISAVLVAGLVMLGLLCLGVVWVYSQMRRPLHTIAGPWNLREADRVSTGQQRVDRVVFAAGGNRLAALCPRYDRLVIYDVEPGATLSLAREVELQGRPVALVTFGDRFVVLERPHGDEEHVAPGWWEILDLDGNRIGGRNLAGFYPDDLALSNDGRYAFLISSGQAEGDPKKPMPAFEAFEVDLLSGKARTLNRTEFEPNDDPARLSLSASGQFAAVLLAKTNQTVAFDLSAPENPRPIGRTKASRSDAPYFSESADSDWIMMPVASPSDAIAVSSPRAQAAESTSLPTGSVPRPDYVVCARQRESVVEVMQNSPMYTLGRLPLTGPLNIGRTRPTGLAYSPERGLLAVSTRSGTIHLLEMAWRNNHGSALRGPVSAAPKVPVRR